MANKTYIYSIKNYSCLNTVANRLLIFPEMDLVK
jgi:hypothetical protein